jgi:hypothetical protein
MGAHWSAGACMYFFRVPLLKRLISGMLHQLKRLYGD